MVSTQQLMFLYLYLVYLYQFVRKNVSTQSLRRLLFFFFVNYSVCLLFFQDAFCKVSLTDEISWKMEENLTVAWRHNSLLYLSTSDTEDLHCRWMFHIHMTRQWAKTFHLSCTWIKNVQVPCEGAEIDRKTILNDNGANTIKTTHMTMSHRFNNMWHITKYISQVQCEWII